MTTHAELLKLLLPPVSYDKTGLALSAALMAEGARLDAFMTVVDTLLLETDPRTTDLLLDDWERVYGLPDTCGVAGGTLDERRARLAAKVAETGGLSRTYFEHLAEVMGYADTTVASIRPASCEMSCEVGLYDEPWRQVWTVNLPHEGDNHSFFRADSGCTEAVDYYLVGMAECVFPRLKPAHTLVQFTYNP